MALLLGAGVGQHRKPQNAVPDGWDEARSPVHDVARNDELAVTNFLPRDICLVVEGRRAARRQARRERPLRARTAVAAPIRRARVEPHERAPRARARASSCDDGERGDPEPVPPPSLFDVWHTVTPTLTGPQRMAAFYSLPPRLQDAAWRDLARRTERERAA